ncbi:cupin domain-containing protein [Candidatus Solirubrobacter pratensis]|uniref:cupin domain-containing protein n=1 Tax=Candidatus Solirubrobacter pratensis TaxID=1298857 RepID=UPI0009DBD1A8|nr:cupin domain-containing protein [Candidatus Solirubrobacter pratensis]
MSEMNRRQLLGAAGVIAGAGLVPAVAAGAATQAAGDAPTLPRSSETNRFDFSNKEPQVVRDGGTVTECTGDNFPVLVGNNAASFLLVLKPGAVREPHWHPNAWEVDVPLSGRGRLGIANPDSTFSVQDILPGQIGFIPQGYAHYIENVGSEDMRWVVVFNNTYPDDIGLSTTFGGMPTHTFTDTFSLPEGALADANKPDDTLFIVEPS